MLIAEALEFDSEAQYLLTTGVRHLYGGVKGGQKVARSLGFGPSLAQK
jgi:hypothetical protein